MYDDILYIAGYLVIALAVAGVMGYLDMDEGALLALIWPIFLPLVLLSVGFWYVASLGRKLRRRGR